MAVDVQQPASPWVIRPDHEMPDDDPMAMTLAEGQARVDDGDTGVAIRSSDLIGGPVDRAPEPSSYVGTVIARATEERPPIVSPIWYRRAVQRAFVSSWWSNLWWKARYHAWKLPGCVLTWLWWAVRGFPISVADWWAWVRDPVGKALMENSEHGEHRTTNRRTHNDELRQRWGLTGLVVLVALIVYVAARVGWHHWGRYAVAALLAGALVRLVRVGRPEGAKFVTSPVITRGGWSRLTSEMIRWALVHIKEIKDPSEVEFPREVATVGAGELQVVQLPPGQKASSAVAKREEMASAFGVELDQLFLDVASGRGSNPGQLEVFLLSQPASQFQPHELPRWALASPNARCSVFKPAPFTFDPRFRAVEALLFEMNYLIAGRPGSGKSGLLRALLTIAGLDPTAQLMIAELKGVGDFIDMEPLCSDYVCGLMDEDFERVVHMLEWLIAECDRRGDRIRKAKIAGKAPEGKVTPELAGDPGSGLHPIVLGGDEWHELFGHPNPKIAKRAADLATRIVKRGRALNIIMLIATQIPDKDSLPPNLVRSIGGRLCGAVSDHIANNMILGSGAYRRGWDATGLRPITDAGWCYFAGMFDPQLVRGFYPDRATWLRIVRRMTELRGGRVVGAPVGAGEILEPREVLIDIEEILVARGWDKAQWKELAPILAIEHPATYHALTPDALSADARDAMRSEDGDLPPHRSVKAKDGSGVSLKGCYLSDVRQANQRRAIEHQERLAIEAPEPDEDERPVPDQVGTEEPDTWDQDEDAEPDTEPDAAPDAPARPDADLTDAQRLILMAAELVIGTQRATTAMLQRKLRLGAAACQQVMTALEELEVVAPAGTGYRVIVEPEDADDAQVRVAADLKIGAIDVPDLVPSATSGTGHGTADIWGRWP